MNLLVAWKKVLLFGLFGAAGCLAGWLAGEPFLAVNDVIAKAAGASQGGTLISNSAAPKTEAPPEFQERLKAAGAKTGDVQISLIWNDTNDLDLHCIDPDGFEICYRPSQRRSRSGGELDVDRNASCRNPIPRPVENIYWDRAKPGTYSVYVNFYQQCVGAPTKSQYQVSILNCGDRGEPISQTIEKSLGPDDGPKILVSTFDVKPKVQVIAPAEIDLVAGGAREVPVSVRRYGMPADAPVKITVEGLPDGVTAEPLTLPVPKKTGDQKIADPNEGLLVLKASSSASKRKIKIVAKAAGGEGHQEAELAAQVGFSLLMTLAIGFWTALLAVGLCLALVAGQNKYLGRPLFTSGRVPLPAVLGGAAAAGFASGSLGQVLFYALVAIGIGQLGFLIGWVLLGGLLGFGVSFFIPNLDGKKAALAGLGGGLLGALAFLVMSLLADFVGRFFGAAILGFCIGLMVAVVEVAFRRAWLEVRFSEREVITVNLGPEPVKIGGEARLCTVWARGAADVALKYWIRDGKVYCEDVPSKREAIVGDGDTRAAAAVTVVVRTGNTPAPTAAAPPRPPAPPARPALPVPPPAPPAYPAAVSRPPAPPAMPPKPPAPPAPVTKPSAAPPKPAPSADYDDGLPMPVSPPPPARPVVRSILDMDDAPPARPPAKPAPAPAKPQVATPAAPKPPAPASASVAPKPPAPPPAARSIAPPAPKPPGAGPVIAAKPGEDSCPTCGRKISGNAGARYCMVCDKTF